MSALLVSGDLGAGSGFGPLAAEANLTRAPGRRNRLVAAPPIPRRRPGAAGRVTTHDFRDRALRDI